MKAPIRNALRAWEESFVLTFIEVQSQGEAVTVFNVHDYTHFDSARDAAHGIPIGGCGPDRFPHLGDVHFNSFYKWPGGDHDLRAFAVHEIGHVLGFVGHFTEDGQVMSGYPAGIGCGMYTLRRETDSRTARA